MATPTAARVVDTAAPRVLLVESSVDNREMYATYLTHAGCTVMQAASAHEALHAIERQAPDLIVTDIVLPDEDGLALCRQVRSHPEWDGTPLIALTGLSLTVEQIEAALEAGTSAVLFKPCLPDRLFAEIRRVLASSVRLRADSAALREHAGTLASNAQQLRDRAAKLQEGSRRLLRGLGQEDLMERISRAYAEMPALSLSIDQARRLWNTDRVSCEIAFRALVEGGTLTRRADGAYLAVPTDRRDVAREPTSPAR